jgi:hypothetical protein
MKTRTFLPVVAVLFAAFTLPSHTFAQSTNVKTPNKNQSAKFKSGIFKGSGNLIGSNSTASFIGGGQSNIIFAGFTNGVIGGGFGNVISNDFATVGGGVANTASGEVATVGGGSANTASGGVATVGGGSANTASGGVATVGGGSANTASGGLAAVGGGLLNTASGSRATVGGGDANRASGILATVGGGSGNTASGGSATVGGGSGNTASGNSCVPGGVSADATNTGSFVFNGDSFERTASFANGTFTVRCEGGARFYTATGIGVGPRLAAGGTDWVANSDSNFKTKITAINARDILAKLSQLPISSWQYNHNPNRRYIGPMAQDFHKMFGLGDDDKGISTLDSDGVMYAAIQGLVEELKDRDAQHAKDLSDRDAKIGELEGSSAELKAQNAEVLQELRDIREQISQLPPSH